MHMVQDMSDWGVCLGAIQLSYPGNGLREEGVHVPLWHLPHSFLVHAAPSRSCGAGCLLPSCRLGA